jgi:hypothetical protein
MTSTTIIFALTARRAPLDIGALRENYLLGERVPRSAGERQRILYRNSEREHLT